MRPQSLCIFVILVIVCSLTARAQEASARPQYDSKADVQKTDSVVKVQVRHPRALERIVTAISEEYGWSVDFEDPPYEGSLDLVDDTGPNWRAQHPNAKGVTRIAGGEFKVEYPEGTAAMGSSSEELRILDSVLAAYHGSGNPGRFALRNEGPDRYAVTGVGIRDTTGSMKTISPILDTPVSIEAVERTSLDTVTAILRRLSETTGKQIVFATAPTGYLVNTRVTVGGDLIPARDLLVQALSASKKKLVWRLLYDADVPSYFLSVTYATKLKQGKDGRRTPVALDRVP